MKVVMWVEAVAVMRVLMVVVVLVVVVVMKKVMADLQARKEKRHPVD